MIMLVDTRHAREWMEIRVLTWRLMDIGSGIMQGGCCYYLSLAKIIHVLIVPSSLWAAPTFNLRPLVPFDDEVVIGRNIGIGWWRKCFMTIVSPAPDGSWGRLAKLKYFPLTNMVLWFGYTVMWSSPSSLGFDLDDFFSSFFFFFSSLALINASLFFFSTSASAFFSSALAILFRTSGDIFRHSSGEYLDGLVVDEIRRRPRSSIR